MPPDDRRENATEKDNTKERDDEEEKKGIAGIDLSVPQVIGAGIATLTAAVAASFLGVYGTVIGAAMMSVISTSGTAVAQHFLQRSGDKARRLAGSVRGTPLARRGPVVGEPTEPVLTVPVPQISPAAATATAEMPAAGHATMTDGDDTAAEDATGDATDDEGTLRKRWRVLLVSGVVTFLAVMALVTVFELFTGRALTDTLHGETGSSAPTVFGGAAGVVEEPGEDIGELDGQDSDTTGQPAPDTDADSDGSVPAEVAPEATAAPGGGDTGVTSGGDSGEPGGVEDGADDAPQEPLEEAPAEEPVPPAPS